jgi:hypothetical protein
MTLFGPPFWLLYPGKKNLITIFSENPKMEKRIPFCLVLVDFGEERYVCAMRCNMGAKIAEIFCHARRFKILEVSTPIKKWKFIYESLCRKFGPYPKISFVGVNLWSVDKRRALKAFRGSIEDNGTKMFVPKKFEPYMTWTAPRSSLFIASDEMEEHILFGRAFSVREEMKERNLTCLMRSRKFAHPLDDLVNDWRENLMADDSDEIVVFELGFKVKKEPGADEGEIIDEALQVLQRLFKLHGKQKAQMLKCTKYGSLPKKKKVD